MATTTFSIPRSFWPLALLFAPGPRVFSEPVEGSIRLMKELFLLGQRARPTDFYDFIPYRYGPCAFEVYKDLDFLKSEGYLKETPTPGSRYPTYQLTELGVEFGRVAFDLLPNEARDEMVRVKREFNRMPIYALLSYVYENYPEFATRTEWAF